MVEDKKKKTKTSINEVKDFKEDKKSMSKKADSKKADSKKANSKKT